ncbi:MAG: hypothetical protein K0S32_484 [Bacteroidetes bacterium]|nr:hypothetical protein [Bacteroidota bacterium]
MKRACFLHILTFFFSIHAHAQSEPGQWEYLGPKQTSGQVKGFVRALWVDTNNMNLMFAGSCSGGLFKSINAMSDKPEWKNISDTYEGMCFGVTDIVVHKNYSDVNQGRSVFIATGHKSGLPLGYGNGILRSDDDGTSWRQVGPPSETKNLFCLEGLTSYHQDPMHMMAYSSNAIYLTKNDWLDWEKIELPFNKNDPDISICDIEYAPFELGKFYVCTRTNNREEAKLYLCEDFGKKIKDITPANVKASRIEVTAVPRQDLKYMFYVAMGASAAYIKFFNGNKFIDLNKQPIQHTFGGTYWNLELCVNAVDTTVMYVAMTEISKSTDGGKTFSKIASYNGKNTHADVRSMQLVRNTHKGADDALFVGNDGGISFAQKHSPTEWRNLNGNGLDVTQFWGIDVAQSDSLLVTGGTQDNGGFVFNEKECLNTMSNCGDGYLAAAIDETSAIVECNPPGLFYHDLKSKGSMYLQVNDPHTDPRRPLFVKDSFVYIGHHDIWRINKTDLKKGQNQFKKFSDISFSKKDDGGIRNHVIKSMSLGKTSGIISYANPLWGDKELSGKLFFCVDINAKKQQWLDITSKALIGTFEICRWAEISIAEIHPSNPNLFYTVGRDQDNQTNCRLLEVEYLPDSNNCVIKEINYNIPKVGINKIKIDKFNNVIYLGCDDGVYYSEQEGDKIIWKRLYSKEKPLPRVMVTDMAINYVNNTLIAGTYGRGAWVTQLVSKASSHKKIISVSTGKEAVKIDGIVVVNKRKSYLIESKLILTKGSRIILKKKSTLIVKDKNLIRDENNSLADIMNYVTKEKDAKVIFR